VAGSAVERLLAIDKINNIYFEACQIDDDRAFMDKCLDVMRVEYEVAEEDLARIPKTGRVVVVANHPFGGVEGIILASLLHTVRDDFKLMANFLLERVEGLRPWMIFVDPFDRAESARVNMKPLKECLRWLRDDHMMAVFPSGTVSHLSFRRGGVVDPPWSPTIGRIVRSTESTVLPIFVQGSNGLLFQLAGMVHPRIRTALLPNEIANKKNKTIRIRIGHPIPFDTLKQYDDDQELMDYLRIRTYHLKNRKPESSGRRRMVLPLRFGRPDRTAVARPLDAAQIAADVERLPGSQRLLENNTLAVYYARADQIPNLLHEIGRLREITFRDAGEGTGHALDLDRFDDYYLHLFVWSREKKELVGAYRLGQTDEILPRFGKRGLYTSTLFRYRRKLLGSLNPGLEVGRSFIRKEYQRNFASLLLLWKGIGQFVARHPRYKILFGPVSVNADYTRKSQELMVQFLKDNNALPDLARLVKARRPLLVNPISGFRNRRISRLVRDLDEVEQFIADIESKMQGVPVLLRQYMKLGGQLLGFNIDPDFGNCLDGLILVDLTKTDPTILNRYLGREGLEAFCKHHGMPVPAPVRPEAK
jgi:putative hemolysin